jgi:uncharacterized protein with HEPN domain
LEAYLADEMCQAALARQPEVAGDALGWLRNVAPAVVDRIPDDSLSVALRNVLAHGDATHDHERLYFAATRMVDALTRTREDLLADFSERWTTIQTACKGAICTCLRSESGTRRASVQGTPKGGHAVGVRKSPGGEKCVRDWMVNSRLRFPP